MKRTLWLLLLGLVLSASVLGACAGDEEASDSATGGAGGDGAGTSTGGALLPQVFATLPLEVLGDGDPNAPPIAEVNLDVEEGDLSTIDQLWFRCHRCGFYGAPEFEETSSPPVRVKASVRVLGGAGEKDEASVPWLDLTDENVVLPASERLQGGLNGGLFTTRVTVVLDQATKGRLVAAPGHNRIQFRFNGTDGESNGFRILDLSFKDAGGKNLSTHELVAFDPAKERDVSALDAADVKAGRALWYGNGNLVKSAIVSRKIRASCSNCHAADGRDLQYFNYSNFAITARSRFHGLSERQGRQIAAFVRETQKEVPNFERARPWNPPYQPGPGLDCKSADCAGRWSAGAGLEAVLETPEQALRALFGKSAMGAFDVSQADVDALMDATATHNVRETAIAMQFPDWNAWLPTVHPLDVWPTGKSEGSFEEGGTFSNGSFDPKGRYEAIRTWLTNHANPEKFADYAHLSPSERAEIMALFTNTGWDAYSFFGGGRGNHIAASGEYGAQRGAKNLMEFLSAKTAENGPAGAFTTNAFIERAVMSVLHWNAVQQWDLAQTFGLEGDQTWFIGSVETDDGTWKGRGEAHGWPFNAPSLFFLAPHMTYQTDVDAENKTTREWILAWETERVVGSYYRTNQWYQLQMTVNPGAQSDWVNFSMDWPYLTGFDELIAEKVGGETEEARLVRDTHYVRLLQGRIKSAQYVNNEIPLYDPAVADLFANRGRYGRGQALKHLSTKNYLDKATPEGVNQSPYHFLEEANAGLYLRVVNGSIQQFNQLYSETAPSAWRRCDPGNTQLGEPENIAGFRYCLDAAKTALGTNPDSSKFMNYTGAYGITTEQAEQYGLWKAGMLGAEATRLNAWAAWIDAVWP